MPGTLTTPHAPTLVQDFEAIYAEARGDVSRIPWADCRPHPALVSWLNVVAPSLVRCGGRVAVIGCGLGDDARELMRRGYDVIAFDCSPTAVRWARQLDPAHESSYVEADLFDMPPRWRHRFDLVVEVNTLQSLPIEQRGEAMKCAAELVTRHGHLLVICRGCETPASAGDGPPWPLTKHELLELASAAGLRPEGQIAAFEDDETPPVLRLRGVFRHGV